MRKRRRISLRRRIGEKGCLCPDEDIYHPDCCDPDNIWGQTAGVRYGTVPEPIPEPSLGYGLLYNWYAATDERGIAPSGFRVPTSSDLSTLLSNATYQSIRSPRQMIDGEPYWSPNDNSITNSSGFTALPAGWRRVANPQYSNFHGSMAVLSATLDDSDRYIILIISSNFTGLFQSSFELKNTGVSIRCVSDIEPATTLVQDADGNGYSWVQIGSQYWLQQSLKTTTYNNGDPIPTDLNNTEWANTTDGAWAYPNGDSNLPI